MNTHLPHVIFSRVDHRRSRYNGCECQQCTPTLYDIALGDPELAAELVDASKGGNVPGITEDHRFELMKVSRREVSQPANQFTETQRAMIAFAILLTETGAADLRRGDPLCVRHAIERFESLKTILERL